MPKKSTLKTPGSPAVDRAAAGSGGLRWKKVDGVLIADLGDVEFEIWTPDDWQARRLLITAFDSRRDGSTSVKTLNECGLEVWKGDECVFSSERTNDLFASIATAKRIATAIARGFRQNDQTQRTASNTP